MPTAMKGRMSVEELREQVCYRNLTDKQRLLVENWIASEGDRAFSVMAAYDVKDANVARKYSYEALASPAVVECLTVFYQNDPKEEFKKQVQRALRSGRLTVAEIRAMELLCKMNGWYSDTLPNTNGYEPKLVRVDSPDYKVGDLITQNGVKYRVSEVDATGKVLNAEEVL